MFSQIIISVVFAFNTANAGLIPGAIPDAIIERINNGKYDVSKLYVDGNAPFCGYYCDFQENWDKGLVPTDSMLISVFNSVSQCRDGMVGKNIPRWKKDIICDKNKIGDGCGSGCKAVLIKKKDIKN